jgi:hypothetical protein
VSSSVEPDFHGWPNEDSAWSAVVSGPTTDLHPSAEELSDFENETEHISEPGLVFIQISSDQ